MFSRIGTWALRVGVSVFGVGMDLSNSCEIGLFIHGRQWDLLEFHSSHRRVACSSSLLMTPLAVRAKTHGAPGRGCCLFRVRPEKSMFVCAKHLLSSMIVAQSARTFISVIIFSDGNDHG